MIDYRKNGDNMVKIKTMVDRTLAYYLIIGVLNFIFCTGIMFVLFNMCGFSEHIAPIVNYALGSLIWYLSCHYILFRDSKTTWQGVLRFVIEVFVCYILSYYVIAQPVSAWLLKNHSIESFFDFGGAAKTVGNCEMTVGSIVYAIINYFGQRYFVFTERFEYHRRQRENNKK